MNKVENFKKELSLIVDPVIKSWVEKTLEIAPERFWKIPASSTGKYHPQCTNKEGGLIIHVKRVVYLADRLTFAWNIKEQNRDIVIAACILHDISKTGKDSGAYIDYVNHPINAGIEFKKAVSGTGGVVDLVENCIKYHMGLWTPDSIKKPLNKYTSLELVTYTSDYMASTKDLVTPVDGEYVVEDK
jgi:hypothetical protein